MFKESRRISLDNKTIVTTNRDGEPDVKEHKTAKAAKTEFTELLNNLLDENTRWEFAPDGSVIVFTRE